MSNTAGENFMRARFTLIVLVLLAAAGFVALNMGEFSRSTPLNFGIATVDASLGWVMLGFVVLILLASMLTGAIAETRNFVDFRAQAKEIERHRELADRAEASRFTELRTYLDAQLKEMRQRDAIAATELEKARLEHQRELRAQLDAMNRVLATRLGELERRLDGRPVSVPPSTLAAEDIPVVDERPTLGDRMRAAMRR
ncbi:hypothetical protein [Ramlibacter albus]|uniref:LapA family protein n=1 Tax=Ramlibacter albus TaxID=2079448 RepID=A0A923M7N4_9BURK|nr:hypothetical protein [Ramlibacter albus]MBC5764398.1 hypothetical protein [Ramlibacter albus]